MKKTLLFVFTSLLLRLSFAQTATNFTCDDCSGTNHDLFTELNAGKVIVLCWVMPCGSCVGPSLTTSNVVESFATSYPDKVFMYLVDDFANTSCTSLNSWANNNNIHPASVFSNSSIKMSDYGSQGMPKVVVVADVNHAVFYNANDIVNASALQEAINTAITSTTTRIAEDKTIFSSLEFFPNPSSTSSSIVFSLEKSSDIKVEILDQLGKRVYEMNLDNLSAGENIIEISTAELSNGIYFVKLSDGIQSKMIKVAIIH
jgi:hypothetical protein